MNIFKYTISYNNNIIYILYIKFKKNIIKYIILIIQNLCLNIVNIIIKILRNKYNYNNIYYNYNLKNIYIKNIYFL